MIVVVEGIDRVGKTTLCKKLEKMGFTYYSDLFLDRSRLDSDAVRHEKIHTQLTFINALERDHNIVVDRCYLTEAVYSMAGRGGKWDEYLKYVKDIESVISRKNVFMILVQPTDVTESGSQHGSDLHKHDVLFNMFYEKSELKKIKCNYKTMDEAIRKFMVVVRKVEMQCNSPLNISKFALEISRRCVARCYLCQKEQGENPSYDSLTAMIDNMILVGMRSVRLTGGEPILANDFVKLIHYLMFHNIYIELTTTLNTTKSWIMDALLHVDKIRVSLSAVGNYYETYFQIDNKWFDIVDSNLRYLLEKGKKIEIHYLLSERTSKPEQLNAFIGYVNSLVDSYGTDSFDVVYIKELGSTNSTETGSQTPVLCMMAQETMFVKSNGKAYPCCVSGGEVLNEVDEALCVGDFNDATFELGSFHKYVASGERCVREICKDCFESYKAINRQLMGGKRHV